MRKSLNLNVCSFYLDKKNKEAVSAIQRGIFTLCLDGAMPKVAEDMHHSVAAIQMLHGGGSQWNSCNRWFDQTLQVKHIVQCRAAAKHYFDCPILKQSTVQFMKPRVT